ncbi:MAG: 3-deoxy-D-manno-octulosonic acid transferase [Roseinatronobacter sp.]
MTPPLAQTHDPARLLWFHTDTQAGMGKLTALWHALAHDLPEVSLIQSVPDTLNAPFPTLPRCTQFALPKGSGFAQLAARFGTSFPAAALIHVRALPPALVQLPQDHRIPLLWVDADYPRVAGLRGQIPVMRGRILRKLARVFVPGPEYQRGWEQVGVTTEQIIPCSWLSAAPPALPVNEAERDALAEALRQRTVWLACSVPEAEEGFVLAALRETLRESHRSVLILRPENPARGPALKAALSDRFVTALRSVDDPITSETQVYIADTEGERGLWYRLAVACYLGGTLSRRGAVQSPYDAANLGCAIVHGRDLGAHTEAFAHFADAQATRRILRPEALGRAMCATLRPDAAALLAGRAWDVVSDGADAYEAVAKALKDILRSNHAAP